MKSIVIGNTTLDVICQTVDDVPRYESLVFERATISPGGCGSNVTIGLCALGISTVLICRIGVDDASYIVEQTWKRVGLDLRFVIRDSILKTAVSVGLVDSCAQPRFIHTPGANAGLTVDDVDIDQIAALGAQSIHIAGYFVLPGLMDGRLPAVLELARQKKILTTLDVVNSFHINNPESLWPCMPYLDVFLCNKVEGRKLTGEENPTAIAACLREKGASGVVVKLGAEGCFADSDTFCGTVPAPAVNVVDTTGAGDAFAAGLVAALVSGSDLESACLAGNRAGSRMVTTLGAIAGWF